jgi:hypothetical protein
VRRYRIRCGSERRMQMNYRCRAEMYLDGVETGLWWLARDEGRGEPAECSTGARHKGSVTLNQASARNWGICRLDAKGEYQADSLREMESTNARHRDGDARSRVEGSVMELDRRGVVTQPWRADNLLWG